MHSHLLPRMLTSKHALRVSQRRRVVSMGPQTVWQLSLSVTSTTTSAVPAMSYSSADFLVGPAGILTLCQERCWNPHQTSHQLKFLGSEDDIWKNKIGQRKCLLFFHVCTLMREINKFGLYKTELPFLIHKAGNGHTFPFLRGEIYFIFFIKSVFACMYSYAPCMLGTHEG